MLCLAPTKLQSNHDKTFGCSSDLELGPGEDHDRFHTANLLPLVGHWHSGSALVSIKNLSQRAEQNEIYLFVPKIYIN